MKPFHATHPGLTTLRPPGPLGGAAVGVWESWLPTPGPLGWNDPADPTRVTANTLEDDPDTRLLAAVAYGEASVLDVFEEMAAIASVIVKQARARGESLPSLLSPGSTFAFAASDGNRRTAAFQSATPEQRHANTGMRHALEAARHAMTDGHDFSNGGWFWDGNDIKTNYARHFKVRRGIRFSDPAHNIHKIEPNAVLVTTYWDPGTNTKVRGSYQETYVSTAAYGQTVFWRYTEEFLKATGNKVYH